MEQWHLMARNTHFKKQSNLVSGGEYGTVKNKKPGLSSWFFIVSKSKCNNLIYKTY